MEIQPMRAAVIGGSKIAELGHLPGYEAAGVEVVALSDHSPARLERIMVRPRFRWFFGRMRP